MAQYMEVRNKKIVALIDTTGGKPEATHGGELIKLDLTAYNILRAVNGNIKALAVYAKAIEEQLEKSEES